MKLPPDLPESYRRLLERVSRCKSAFIQAMMQNCLLFIAYAEPKLGILALRQAVSTPDAVGSFLDENNTISEREIFRWCSSLIRKSEGGRYLEFAHFSVQEFLENQMTLLASESHPNLAAYFINRRLGERTLATQCLKFLLLKNFDERPGSQEAAELLNSAREHDFPFYSDAALRWVRLIGEQGLSFDSEDDTELLNLMTALFQPRQSSNFASWALEIVYDLQAEDYSIEKEHKSMRFDLWNMVSDGTLAHFMWLRLSAFQRCVSASYQMPRPHTLAPKHSAHSTSL